jgi:diguanylate cyclase (GGDEF)-like protein
VAELQALLDITARINSCFLLGEILDHVYQSFKALIPYDRLGCALIDSTGRSVRAIWARSTRDELEIQPGYQSPLEGSSLARIIAAGEPRILNDLTQHLRDHPHSDSTRRIVREGVRSSLTCPLVVAGNPTGFLFFSSHEPGTYAAGHAAIYREITAQVSLIVDKARVHEELVETHRQLLEVNEVLQRTANTDSLTGVPNRRFFDLVLEREWQRARRLGEPFSLILIDIDCFKQFNDLYGHPAGDACLTRVASALARCSRRGTDLLARIGGEEFVALLPETTAAGALSLAESMRQMVAQLGIPHQGSGAASHVTVSMGVAAVTPGADHAAVDLVKRADTALYRAKESGRDRVCVD